MNAEPDPAWHLLPRDPLGFFGLGREFDRKELKRAYNSLIRRFKPEQCPAEFQQIRSAFEALDAGLRYGDAARETMAAPRYEWSGGSGASPLDGSQAGSPRTPRVSRPVGAAHPPEVPLTQQVGERPLRDVYADLNRKPQKSPFDYYALAVLSDTVGRDPLLFAHWLLAGLQAHPQDPALMRLLYTYFRSDVPVESVPKLLTVTAKVVKNDRFYQLTEPLWDEFLRCADFTTFRGTLEKCEQLLVDHRIHAKLVFYLHLLRPCVWKADPGWITHVARLLEENRDQLPPALEPDLELTLLFVEYRESAENLPTSHPVRARIEQAMRAYCTREEAEADREVIECQVQLAADGAGVLEAFPLSDDTSHPMLLPWLILNADVGSRRERELPAPVAEVASAFSHADRATPNSWTELALREAGRPDSDIGRQVLRMLEDIDRQTPWAPLGRCLMAIRIAGYVIAAGVALICLFPIFVIPGGILALVFVPIAPLAYHFTLRQRTAEPLVQRLTTRFLQRHYEQNWRARLQRTLAATHLPVADFVQLMIQLRERHGARASMAHILSSFLNRDVGLTVYSLALRLLR